MKKSHKALKSITNEQLDDLVLHIRTIWPKARTWNEKALRRDLRQTLDDILSSHDWKLGEDGRRRAVPREIQSLKTCALKLLHTLLELLGLADFEKDVRKWLGKDSTNDHVPQGTIVMRGGELVDIVDRAQSALVRSSIPIYQRGGQLVRATKVSHEAERLRCTRN